MLAKVFHVISLTISPPFHYTLASAALKRVVFHVLQYHGSICAQLPSAR